MPYFFDTNVIVGYLFFDVDRLGPRAKARVEDREENHAGFTTSIECFGTNGHSGKSTRIRNEISGELLEIRSMLESQKLTSFRFRFNPNNFTRTGKTIQQYLDSGQISDENMLKELQEIARKFETAYYQRKRHIKDSDICTWHPKRSNLHAPEERTLSARIQNKNDVQVLLDAYDAGFEIENLLLVTDDHRDILSNKELILASLSTIHEIISP